MHELLSPSACDVVLQEIDITVFSSDHVINGPLVLGTRLGFGWKLATLFTCSYAVSWPTESTVANFIIKKADIIAPYLLQLNHLQLNHLCMPPHHRAVHKQL